jgi:hypothetical protein
MMEPWTLIVSSYALTFVATTGLTLWSWVAMRRAEAEAAKLGERP